MLITAFADQQMSSQLTNLVPVFDGTNYQQWTAAMQSFLMSQGQWKCVKDGANVPEEIKVEDSVTNAAEIMSYLEDAEKAMGNIRLRLHHTIGYQFNSEENPASLWKTLKKKYGVPGISGAFKEFKGIMDTQIPNNSNPSPAIDKIMAHHTCLSEMKWDLPKKVLAMMMLSKAPPSMEVVVQMILQMTDDLGANESLDLDKIVKAMRASWEAHGRAGVSQFNQQQANKLSAVKQAGEPPQFQYQQQQHRESLQQQCGGWGLGGGSKRGRQGKRGGQKNAQQQLQQAMVQQPDPSQQAGPSQPPPHQWVPAPTHPSYASGPANMGYFAAQMKAGCPLPPTPPTPSFQPTKSFFPHFNKAMDLAHRLGVQPTIKTIKKLEMAQQEMVRKPQDPHPTPRNPQKRAQNSQ